MSALWFDLRLAMRALRRAPSLTAVAILSIGLGIGAATTVYSWMDGLVLHPFPAVPDQNRLVGMEVDGASGGMGAWSYQSFKELRDGLSTVTGVAAFSVARASVRVPGEEGSNPLLAATVSGRFFDVLRVAPIIGRPITDADERSAAPVAVLGYQYWQERFNGSANVLGQTLLLNAQPFTVVGVAPPRFSGVYTGVVPHMYVPITTQPLVMGVDRLSDRKLRSWLLFARLAPGASIGDAKREANALALRLSKGYGDRPPTGADVMFLRIQFLGKTLSPLFASMLAVTVLLMLVASANVAGLLLVRADARSGEMALRLALGGSRARLLRTAIAESIVLATGGAMVGLAAAYLLRGGMYTFVPRGVFPISLPIVIGWRVFGNALGAAVFVAVASALAPGISSLRLQPQQTMRASARSLVSAASRLRSGIVMGQLGFCVLLLVLCGMFVRGLRSAAGVDVGFIDPQHVLLVDTDLRAARVTDSTGPVFLDQLLTRIRAIPGVKTASAASMVPLGFGGRRIVEMKVEGYGPRADEDMGAERVQVAGDYPATMNIRVVQGRPINDEDRATTMRVAMVNEAFAKRFFAGTNPLGRRVDAGNGFATIVGVLHDGKYDRLDEGLHPVIYVPYSQFFAPGTTLHVRTTGNPIQLAEPVRKALLASNVDLAALQPRTLAEHISASTFTPRTGATVLAAFAVLALLLSSVGLYAMLSYSVSLRSRELAVRAALGAGRPRAMWTVGRSALGLAGGGLALGGALSLVGAPLLRSQVTSVGAPDLTVEGLTILALLVVSAVAALVPARRATKLDPAVVLRGDG